MFPGFIDLSHMLHVYNIGLESNTDKETNSNKKHPQYLHLEADFICAQAYDNN